MTKLTTLTIALAALAATAPAAPIPDVVKEPVLYFPTTVGTKWTYQCSGTELVLTVTAVEAKAGAHVVSVGRVGEAGVVYKDTKVAVSPRGLHELEVSFLGHEVMPFGPNRVQEWTERREPALCLLRLPAVHGDRWGARHSPGTTVAFEVGREERVRVPAGEFQAVCVEAALDGGWREPTRFRHWYAVGVGEVQRTLRQRDGTEEVIRALKVFTPARR
jgi:hypothetical protein